MGVYAIDHVQLAMPAGAEAQARAFYVDVLGFTEIQKPAELPQRGGAWFKAGEVELHLGIEQDFRPARKAHPALLVKDIRTLVEAILGAGGEVDTSQPALAGYRRVHVSDPFGNRIEIMEKLG